MGNSTKKILASVFFLTILSFAINGQTNVSGGIYSNTTWTLANSPYIVVDTVVVFPGVTLTIQPGVTVKFNNDKRLEIRQAKLIAVGTGIDSITFTSNSSIPTPGIWGNVYLNGGTLHSKFNYCNFRHASTGIIQFTDTATVNNSSFNYNNIGISFDNNGNGYLFSSTILIDSSNFRNNINYGLYMIRPIMNYCNVSHNQIGIHCDNPTTGGQGGFHTLMKFTNCIVDSNQTGMANLANSIVDNCTVNYNHYGIKPVYSGSIIKNSNINYNQYGIISVINSTINNCIITSNNMVGLDLNQADSVINCQIKYNGTGLSDSVSNGLGQNVITQNSIENNTTGIKLWNSNEHIYCNKICNNTAYDIYYSTTNNFSVSNNYWCTSDSSIVSAKIYDGYDNINLGIVSFMPIDTSQCNLTTEILVNALSTFSFGISPNPAFDYLTVTMPTSVSKTEIKIFNMLGELEYSSIETKQNTKIEISALVSGLHIIQIATGSNISSQKFIKR